MGRFLNNKIFLLLLFLIELLYLGREVSYSQTFSFKNYTVEHGLVQSQVYAQTQDSKGYMWFGTTSGISRFNGKKFENFTTKDGLCGNSVNVILEDSFGNVWIGTKSGLSKFNNQSSAKLNFNNFFTVNGLPNNIIRDILQDRDGNLWVATNEGIAVLTKENLSALQNTETSDSSTNLFISLSEKNGLVNNRVWSISQDKKGNLWFGTFNGISVLNADKVDFKNIASQKKIFKNYSEIKVVRNNRVRIVFNDSRDYMWLGSEEGIALTKNNNFVKLFHDNAKINVSIRSIFEDNNGNLWIGTYQNGIAFISSENIKQPSDKWKFELFTLNEGLSNNAILSITQDREGNMWFGTDGGGVLKYRGKTFEAYTTKQGLNNNLVLSVIQDKKGNFLFGTYGGGISYLIPEKNFSKMGLSDKIVGAGGLQSGILLNYTEDNGLLNNFVYNVIEDKNGNYWVSNYGKGVMKYEPSKNTGDIDILHYKPKKGTNFFDAPDNLLDNHVFSIYEDNSQNIWIGTAAGVTVYRHDGNTQKFSTENGLNTPNVMSIFQDMDGDIWLGTNGGGIVLLSEEASNSYKVVGSYSTNDGLINDIIRAIIESSSGHLIVGTNGGLSIEKTEKLKKFIKDKSQKPRSNIRFYGIKNITDKDGISSNDIYSLIFDKNNSLWTGSSKGLDKLKITFDNDSIRIENIKYYGMSEGFWAIEASINAVYKDNEDNLWFGTVQGAFKYNVKADKANLIEPLTQITKYQIFLKDTVLQQNAILPYNLNYITFHFIGICMTNPDKVNYQFKLEGFDKNWLPVTQETYATYSYLMEGDYVFKVKASNNEGIWNENPTTFSFTITPPFWRTWLFYFICTVVILVSIYMFIVLRIRNLEITKKILQEKVEERTLELSKKNIELAQKNKDIIDSIKYAKRIQEAILPVKKEIIKHLPNSFLLYKPKDIVSGDFYWFVHKDNKSIIAAVDCTGHGVPGAFMSMIGNDLLNKFIIENNITKPDEILNNLHEGVRQALKQTDQNSDTKDGMDIGICSINYQERELEFAGALRSLFIWNNNKELKEIKGDRYSIGGFQREKKRIFNSKKIHLQSNDIAYIFTDGCVDQFGGHSNKKFMMRRLNELLLSVQNTDMNNQSALIENGITAWQGNLEQTDDILMIGIKF